MATLTFDFLRGYVLGERRMSVPVAYQWDQGHVLEVKIPTAVTSAEIHYSQSGMAGADAYDPESITAGTDGTCTITAHVPNSLFVNGCSVEVYVVVTDNDACVTTYQGRIHVVGREKPDDYVDDDPENEAVRILVEAREAAATATAAAETCEEVAESIPSDYSTLSNDVTNLKQDYNSLSESKADKTANNPSMGAGYASQLVSSLRKSDSVPYNFRKVPYDSTLEDGSIVGASVAVNQLINANSASDLYSPNATITASNNTVTLTSSVASGNIVRFGKKNGISSVIGHKVLLSGTVTPSVAGGLRVYNGTGWGVLANTTAGTPVSFSVIFDVGTNGFPQDTPFAFSPSANMSNDTIVWKYPQICDLTQMFGTTIADYVYGLETATTGSGVAWLKEHFPKQFGGYQAYNAGEIKSISGLSAHKSVGFNAFDKSKATTGKFVNNDGLLTVDTNCFVTDYIRVFPNTEYYINHVIGTAIHTCAYIECDSDKNVVGWGSAGSGEDKTLTFTTGANTHYIRVNGGTAYIDVTCINLSKPTGTPKDGDYVPYEAHTYALDSTKTLRGILKLDSNNKLYADGDRYLAEGKKDERFNEVDLGSLDWSAGSSYFLAALSDCKDATVNMITTKGYQPLATWGEFSSSTDKTMYKDSNGKLYAKDSAYSDATAYKTALSGEKLVYEKQTATTETASPYSNPQIINPDGTESYVYTDGAFELPVGHESEYPVNVSGQLDDILDTPTTNGTYTLRATVSNGKISYEWVST